MGKFNEQQLKAIECNDKYIVVVAGAGAGKTHTMIHRIKRLVDEGAKPESILVLTFTRAAALEMKERFISLSKGAVISPEFRTFHSFCYHLVLTDADVRLACGYSSVPAIADTADARRILAEAKNQSDFKVSERKMKDRKLMTPKEVYQYEMYKKTLNRLMRAKNLITFDQLSTLVCELFEKNDPSIQMYKEKYKYIVVDEFQDTDNEQFTFISSFKDSNIFVVGDVLQSIYSFRNADSSIMKCLIDDPRWTVIRLYKNYRSATSICNFANKNTTYADPQYRIELDPFREDSGKVDVECCYQENSYDTLPEDCADDILKELKTRRKGNYALLARSNKEVAALSEFLKQNKIDFVTRCRNDESLRILRCVGDNEYFLNYVSTQLDSEKYSQYLRMVYVDAPEDELSYFYEKFRRVPRIKYYMDTVIGIRVVFNDGKLTTYEKIDKILKLLDIKDNIVIDCADDSNRGILQYLIDEITKSTESDIYVGTIHSVKGLEFNNVFLLGVDGASFPLMNEDNHNLYYVGITRAKDYLRVYNYD